MYPCGGGKSAFHFKFAVFYSPEKSFVRGEWELKISENKENIDSDRDKFKKKL